MSLAGFAKADSEQEILADVGTGFTGINIQDTQTHVSKHVKYERLALPTRSSIKSLLVVGRG